MPVRNASKIVDYVTKNVGAAESGVANVVAKLSTSDKTWLGSADAASFRKSLLNTQSLIEHALLKLDVRTVEITE